MNPSVIMAENKPKLNTIRCTNCGRVLFEAEIKDGIVVKKCKCGVINTIISVNKKSASLSGSVQ